MILSMTGFGRGVTQSDTIKITVEIKSLNSKQLDLMMRVPTGLREIEASLRNLIARDLERGKIELSLNMEEIGGETGASVNVEAIGRYRNEILKASEELGMAPPVDWWPLLLRMPEAVRSTHRELTEEDVELCYAAVGEAVGALTSFRIAEGRKLYDFFVSKIDEISLLLGEIEPMEHERIPKIRQRLEDQLSRLESIEYDSGRLEQEMILYIEKLDVTEEKTRLRSHLSYFLETLGRAEEDRLSSGQGKKLGFIAQEMGREINTLGSKSNHAGMQQTVVKMKDALEQIKEQVLNVL